MNRNDVTELIIEAKREGPEVGGRGEEGRPQQGMGDGGLPGPNRLRCQAGEARREDLRPARRSPEVAAGGAGDGIMSAIDFKMDLKRDADPKGDRVDIVMSGKLLPYKGH
jgi:hypothetical protein